MTDATASPRSGSAKAVPDTDAGAALAALRQAGRTAHTRVDAAFSTFRLSDAASYATFLRAHADVVLPLEAHLRRHENTLPPWSPRGDLLRADLAHFGDAAHDPAPWPDTAPAPGWALGALYVLEGSRLGGRVLATQVPDGLPRAYLSAAHENGSWRAFLDAAGALLDRADADFRADAIAGAQACFARFEDAAHSRTAA